MQLAFMPYHSFLTNIMETISLATLQINFYSTTIAGLLNDANDTNIVLDLVLAIWNVVLLGAMVVLVVREKVMLNTTRGDLYKPLVEQLN